MLYKSVTAAIGSILLSQSIQLVAEDISKIPEELLVTASRIEMPLRQIGASVSVLSREDIVQSGYISAQELLRTLPSIHVSSNGGMGSVSALRMRGEEAFRTRILIDGVNQDDTTGTQHSPRIEHVLLGDVERIEVLRGAQGMMYGADAGGVINIITRRGEPGLAGEVSHERGRYGFEQTSGTLRGGAESFDFSAHFNDTDVDGFNARSSDSVLGDEDGYENQTRSITAGADLGDKLRVTGILRSNKSSNEYDSCFQGFSTVHDCRLDYDQFQKKLMLSTGSDEGGATLAWQHSRFERESYVVGVLDTAFGVYKGDSTEWQLKGHRALGSGNLIAGVDVKEETDDLNDTERDQRAVWTEWQGELNDDVFYTIGLRHDSSEDFGDFLTHRATVARIVSLASGGEVKFRASHGSGFRIPALQELRYNQQSFVPAALRDLGEETSRGFDVGADYFGNRSRAGISLFRQQIQDPIDFSETNFYYVQDGGTAYSEGVELNGDFSLTDTLRLQAGATYNDTEATDGGQRARRPRQIYTLGMNYRVPLLPVTLQTQLRRVEDVVDKPFGAPRTALDDYTKLDMNVRWRVSEHLDLWVRGENLLDDEYVEVLTYNTAGPSVHGGVRFHFD